MHLQFVRYDCVHSCALHNIFRFLKVTVHRWPGWSCPHCCLHFACVCLQAVASFIAQHTTILFLISSKATLPSAWRDRCTTPVCCQLWHMVRIPGYWPNKHRTILRPHRPKMERSMLSITYKDIRTNICVRERTKVIDIMYTVRKMKWSWAGHINRLKDNRWTSRATTWKPYDWKRRQGRPA